MEETNVNRLNVEQSPSYPQQLGLARQHTRVKGFRKQILQGIDEIRRLQPA